MLISLKTILYVSAEAQNDARIQLRTLSGEQICEVIFIHFKMRIPAETAAF